MLLRPALLIYTGKVDAGRGTSAPDGLSSQKLVGSLLTEIQEAGRPVSTDGGTLPLELRQMEKARRRLSKSSGLRSKDGSNIDIPGTSLRCSLSWCYSHSNLANITNQQTAYVIQKFIVGPGSLHTTCLLSIKAIFSTVLVYAE